MNDDGNDESDDSGEQNEFDGVLSFPSWRRGALAHLGPLVAIASSPRKYGMILGIQGDSSERGSGDVSEGRRALVLLATLVGVCWSLKSGSPTNPPLAWNPRRSGRVLDAESGVDDTTSRGENPKMTGLSYWDVKLSAFRGQTVRVPFTRW